ncbi:MAG: class I SAM-dependent methyltransferase, partial [Chloroflexota bacterium]|nr:class I SAM-dependent methyltransferase [Chloroflexota bacterium]
MPSPLVGAAKRFAETFKDKAAERAFLRAVSAIAVGNLTLTLPGGEQREFAGAAPGPQAELRVHAERFYAKVLAGGEIGFGEAYQEGLCDSPDLVALIKLAIANRRAVNLNKGPLRLVSKAANRRLHLGRRNTVAQAKHNIHAHYDLGNAFFRLWLDETMTYSSALYAASDESLAGAQRNKYRALCELADVQATDHVLEIGSGWGGFAIFAAQEFGCRVTSITISEEQHRLASERVAEAGLGDRAAIELRDNRDL